MSKSPLAYHSASVVPFTPQPLRSPEQANRQRFNTSADFDGAKPIKYLSKRH